MVEQRESWEAYRVYPIQQNVNILKNSTSDPVSSF